MFKKKAIIVLLSTMMIVSTLAFSNVTVNAAGANGWQQNGTTWNYYINGKKATNWILSNGKWYYLKSNGDMATGWIYWSGKWYYLKSGGDMATGWIYWSGKWYYLKSGGDMATGWISWSGKWYYLKSGGDMATGWIFWNSKWYYLRPNGDMVASQWITWNGKQYYLNTGGDMAVSTTIDGWIVGSDGAWNGQPRNTSTNNKKGYVYNQELQIDLNVRSAPNLSSTILGHLYNYEKVEILDTIVDTSGNHWDKIYYNNSYAYVSNAYIQLYTSPPDDVVNISKNITKQFEVGNGKQIAGNFDGQGLSLGYLQWCIGQRTLQPLLNRMNREYPDEMEGIFGTTNYTSLQSMILDTPENQLAWANSINDSTDNIIEPWYSQFVSLYNNQDFINIEADAEVYTVKQAMIICDKYNIKTVRGFALAFDIVVQNGSISSNASKIIDAALAQNPNMTEKNLLGVIANAVSDSSASNSEDIRSREMAIVNGQGIVHGSLINLDMNYGLNDNIWR